MELRHLKLVDTVAREGTLSKAAEKLHLTQSALSHQLKELETELGTLMFNRVKKRLVISDAGKIIRGAALKIQADLEQAKEDLRKQQDGQKGDIKLSTECYTCYHWLPEVLVGFQREFQQIDVDILPEYTKDHINGLINKRLDLVITSENAPYENIRYEDLFRDEQLVIVPQDHLWSSRQFVVAQDFKYENLIIYNKPVEDSHFYRNVLIPNGVEPKGITEIRLTEAAIELIKNNFGVMVMARWAAAPYLKSNDLAAIPITANGQYRRWYLAYNSEAGWKPHYSYFKKHLMSSLHLYSDELISIQA